MKRNQFLIGALFLASSTFAQWTGTTTPTTTTSNLGIGTLIPRQALDIPAGKILLGYPAGSATLPTSPFSLSIKASEVTSSSYPIHVQQSNSNTDLFWLTGLGGGYYKGDLGVGITSPLQKLHVLGNGLFTSSMAANYATFLIDVNSDAASVIVNASRKDNSSISRYLVFNKNGGNVGIGVGEPLQKLHVVGSGLFASSIAGHYPAFLIDVNSDEQNVIFEAFRKDDPTNTGRGIILNKTGGYVGIATGAAALVEQLQIGNGNIRMDAGYSLNWQNGSATRKAYIQMNNSDNLMLSSTQKMVFYTGTDIQRMVIDVNGNVGIGSDLSSNSYGHKLAVNGSIRAKEVVIETGWADYVFADGYALKPLSEVEAYIEKNNTLPNVPSEQKIKEDNIGLGELTKIQQEKIEELTLYIIEMNKEIQALKAEVNLLK